MLTIIALTGYLIFFYNKSGSIHKAILVTVLTFALIIPQIYNLDYIISSYFYKGEDIIYKEETPYNQLVITQDNKQNNII